MFTIDGSLEITVGRGGFFSSRDPIYSRILINDRDFKGEKVR